MKQEEIVKRKTVHNAMKNIARMKISHSASERLYEVLNNFGLAIVESSITSAVLEERKTILDKDVDISLDALCNTLRALNEISHNTNDNFSSEEDFDEDNGFF